MMWTVRVVPLSLCAALLVFIGTFMPFIPRIAYRTFSQQRDCLLSWLDYYQEIVLHIAMIANGTVLWCFTSELDLQAGEKVESTLVSTDPLTFHVNNQTIIFPKGNIKSVTDNLAPLGFWIITPASVKPTIR